MLSKIFAVMLVMLLQCFYQPGQAVIVPPIDGEPARELYVELAGEGRFRLDLSSGSLSLDGRELCMLDLPSIYNPDSWYEPHGFSIQRTPAGNYLFQTGGIGSGALTFGYQITAYVPQSGGRVRTCCASSILEPIPQPFWQGRTLWLPDEETSVAIDDRTGEISELPAGLGGWCLWADKRYLLLTGLRLYDRKSREVQDLTPLLLTDEVKAKAEAFLQSTQDFDIPADWFDEYWRYLNYGLPLADPVPSLRFNYAEGKKLYFTLFCNYRSGAEGGIKEYPLVYKF